MLHMIKRLLIITSIILISTSCSSGELTEIQATPTIAPPRNPYQASSQTPQPETATVPLPTSETLASSEPLIPTATPFKHAVQPGETLYGIAVQYNITLDELVLANPGVNTNTLSIGTELNIPLIDNPLLVATPTPYPLPLSEPACYPTEDEGLWCYLMLNNDREIALENITVAFNLFADRQELVHSVIASPALNRLFPGQSIPVGAWIEDPPQNLTGITASLLTAFPSDLDDSQVEITDYSVTYSLENRIATVSGMYQIINPEASGSQVWIVGIALSEDIPSGVRKWVSSQELSTETSYDFEFQIYSLGPAIDRIQLLAELD
jgi:LysM repeat protein